MGVDMGSYDELIATHKSVSEIGQEFGADSLAFLSLEKMMSAIGSSNGYCNACFTGRYPLPITEGISKTGFDVPTE